MFRPKARSGHPHLFSCAKAASPIPARHRMTPKRLVDHHVMPKGTILIDRVNPDQGGSIHE
ncbi:hypothetical protein [Bradyrhizobium canariense]|uniref:hypothetical protein n=1 Tax=Bradyrhizobium canariense TaxID=255045 RepID=UPI000A196A23|nr:hypothetical protein [Bradyrhizobium canariense]